MIGTVKPYSELGGYLVTLQERIRLAKEFMAAQAVYDDAFTGYNGNLYEGTVAVEELYPPQALPTYPSGLKFQPVTRLVHFFHPYHAEKFNRACDRYYPARTAANDNAVVKRPKLTGPLAKTYYHQGFLVYYGRRSTIRVAEDYQPFPPEEIPYQIDASDLFYAFLQRWELVMDGMYISEYLKEGGFLWELERHMKAGGVWMVGRDCGRVPCDRESYMEVRKEIGLL